MTHLVRLLLATCLCVTAASPALAQGGGAAATVVGTVTDPSGAVIPGATVVVKNNATGTEFTAVTNEQGGFTIPAIDPGV